jgi:excisionase family DNA binding protein
MDDMKTKFNKLPDPLTVSEVSDLFRCHRDTVMRWCRTGEIEGHQLCNRGEWKIFKHSLEGKFFKGDFK